VKDAKEEEEKEGCRCGRGGVRICLRPDPVLQQMCSLDSFNLVSSANSWLIFFGPSRSSVDLGL